MITLFTNCSDLIILWCVQISSYYDESYAVWARLSNGLVKWFVHLVPPRNKQNRTLRESDRFRRSKVRTSSEMNLTQLDASFRMVMSSVVIWRKWRSTDDLKITVKVSHMPRKIYGLKLSDGSAGWREIYSAHETAFKYTVYVPFHMYVCYVFFTGRKMSVQK